MQSSKWLIAVFSLFGISQAQAETEVAQDELPIIDMDAVVVTATQTEEDAFTTAKSIDKVDQEQLDIEQSESIAESTQQLSNVAISQGPRQISQQVNIRGLSGKEVLQVLDNARQNFQNGHQGSFFVDPELLKEVEVLKGPGSSLWGSGAIGGVVSMTTVSPDDLLKEDQIIGAKIKGGADSNDHMLYTSDSVYGRAGENNEYLLNFTYRDDDDVVAGGGETIPNSAFRDQSEMVKWVSHFDENQTLTLSFIEFDAYQTVPSDPRQNDEGSKNPLVDQHISQQNYNATYKFADPDNDWVDLTSTLYFNDTEVNDDCLGECSARNGGPYRHDSTRFTTFGINGRNSSYLPWSTLTIGGEFYQDNTTGERNDEPRQQFPEAKTDVGAGYVQLEIPFWETWTLTPGVRYDHFRNDPEGAIDEETGQVLPVQTEGDWSPSISLAWQTTPWMQLIAIYDEAFRAPAIDELYPTGPHFTVGPLGPRENIGPFVNTFVPNPNLKPETAHNKEFSARFSWDELLDSSDSFRARISVFRNDVDNYIQQQITSPITTQYVNISDAELSGVEIDTVYQIQSWYVGIAYGFVHGINKSPIENSPYGLGDQTGYLDDIPPERIIFTGGRYFYNNTLLTGLRLTGAWAQDKVSQPENCEPNSPSPANACPIPGYVTFDVFTAWEPVKYKLDGLRVDFSINNINDQKYYASTSALLPQEGRNVRVSLSYTF